VLLVVADIALANLSAQLEHVSRGHPNTDEVEAFATSEVDNKASIRYNAADDARLTCLFIAKDQ
jgi:hypothetical protein